MIKASVVLTKTTTKNVLNLISYFLIILPVKNITRYVGTRPQYPSVKQNAKLLSKKPEPKSITEARIKNTQKSKIEGMNRPKHRKIIRLASGIENSVKK
jgi:hypothetical protein